MGCNNGKNAEAPSEPAPVSRKEEEKPADKPCEKEAGMAKDRTGASNPDAETNEPAQSETHIATENTQSSVRESEKAEANQFVELKDKEEDQQSQKEEPERVQTPAHSRPQSALSAIIEKKNIENTSDGEKVGERAITHPEAEDIDISDAARANPTWPNTPEKEADAAKVADSKQPESTWPNTPEKQVAKPKTPELPSEKPKTPELPSEKPKTPELRSEKSFQKSESLMAGEREDDRNVKSDAEEDDGVSGKRVGEREEKEIGQKSDSLVRHTPSPTGATEDNTSVAAEATKETPAETTETADQEKAANGGEEAPATSAVTDGEEKKEE